MDSLFNKCRNSTGKENDEFVGIRYANDMEIIFPIGFNIPLNEKDLKKATLNLIKSIELTKSIYKEKFKSDDKSDYNNLSIYSYFWLIYDFKINGLYKQKERNISQNPLGKINWKKTIQNTQAFISKDSFVYLNPFYENTLNSENQITEIYKYCLNKSKIYFDWLYSDIKVDKSRFNDNQVEIMIRILKREIKLTFLDYKLELYDNLLKILNDFSGNKKKTNIYSFGTNKYENVWESMINKAFGNVEDISAYYPTSYWNISLNNKRTQIQNLRQDTIYYDKDKDLYYILDSKYYNAYQDSSLAGLPTIRDIEKQITYGEELHKRMNIDSNKICNAMILPYNKHNNLFGLSNDIEYIGSSNVSWKNDSYKYEKVQLIFADTAYVIEQWLHKNNDETSKLYELIDNR